MSVSRAAVVWRYLPGGRGVKHALRVDGGPVGHPSYAICGTTSAWSAVQWRGSGGSQAEYEQVDRLPECRRCARLLVGATP